ncbi:variant erythrocyte surface antigen-1 family protein [Babesia caballi]|uniref:Variant erythrocyte surface antigen-1 family protein n=1 Tax=Babesia caballi TaxID=5871 RepID=A0AAV4LYP0_BABCB|nr:variant erythrocyte surface antigen-1 family protein [Babesia caballi]
MAGQKKSLTDPPTNLKEAIDWLALVGGGYGRNDWISGKRTELKSALDKLLNWNTLKSELKINVDLDGLIKKLADGLGAGFLGYQGSTSFGSNGIIKQDDYGGRYIPTYKSAEWQVGLENDYAKVFLGAAVMAYYGITYLYWKCKIGYGGWGSFRLNGGGSDPLSLFMVNMGFKTNELQNINGSQVVERLTSDHIYGFDELKNVQNSYQSPYSDFLIQLEDRGPAQGINCPLTNCFILAKEYIKSQFTKSQGPRIDGTLTSIKEALPSFKSSCQTSAQDLYYQINNFISTYMPETSSPNPGGVSAQSSPAAPVAGTLTTLGLGGGAAAAYIFNLGGAKTLVNGLLKIG